MAYSYLLSDELAELYLNHKNGKKVNQGLLELFLSFYEPVPFCSLDQLNKYAPENVEARQALLASGYSAKTEAQVLDETKYKIILTTDSNNYPCVNINNGNLKKEIVISYRAGESRDETIKHLKNLCKNAHNIILCDKYMFDGLNVEDTPIAKFFNNILDSKNKINIYYRTKNGNLKKYITYLKGIRQNCILRPCQKGIYDEVHDRYLMIDNKLEIILSSGMEYLFDTTKEISLICRKIR